MKTKQTTNGMYALLVVVAAFLATGIYFACSADDDFATDTDIQSYALRNMRKVPEPTNTKYHGVENVQAYHGNLHSTCSLEISVTCTYDDINDTCLLSSHYVKCSADPSNNVAHSYSGFYCTKTNSGWYFNGNLHVNDHYSSSGMDTLHVQIKLK